MIDFMPACHRMVELLSGVGDDQLAGPTPCADYAVRDLIEHVDQVARGFTALARNEDDDAAAGAAIDGDDWRTSVGVRVEGLGEAWADPVAWRRSTDSGGLELSNELWGKIAFTEIVVHGWDLARATGQPFDLPAETLRACWDHVAEFVPNAPIPELWAPPVELPADAPLIDRIVAITGRDPAR